jgi:hypothetical protein
MLTQDNLTEWIDNYLDKTLSTEELSSFEDYIANHPETKKAIAAQKLVREALRKNSRATLKAQLKQVHTEMLQENNAIPLHTRTNTEKNRRYLLVGAAAVVLLMVAVGVYQFTNPIDDQGNLVATHQKVFKIEYVEQHTEAQGFAGEGTTGKDYKTLVLRHTDTYDKPHYEFIHPDTITLFSNNLNPTQQKIQLQYDTPSNSYKLVIDGQAFEVEQGFKGIRELKK